MRSSSTARAHGAIGAKALGASGGGSVVIIAPEERVDEVRAHVSALARLLPFIVDRQGAHADDSRGSGEHGMAELTTEQYDRLERAVIDKKRISVYRRGTEYIVVPKRLHLLDGRERIEAVHPNTGDAIVFYLDEIESLQVIR